MKPTFRHIISGVAVTALLLTGGSALAQIAGTKHNLGSTNTRTTDNRSNVDDLCVFCHTPHGGDTGATAPLWNRALDNDPANTYTTYDSLGIDGNTLTVGSVSLACLSCHDGTQALDTVLNAPGSGGLTTGARMQVGDPAANPTWAGPNVDAATGKLGTGVANLTTDLSNDHPIGIIYGGYGGRQDLTDPLNPVNVTIDPDFFAPSSGTTGSGTTVWWVDSEFDANGLRTPDSTRQKTDMQLYTRTTPLAALPGGDQTGRQDEPYVECASCHDPHIANATFLRISNVGSRVCLSCHNK